MHELLPVKWEEFEKLPSIVGFPVYYSISPKMTFMLWPSLKGDDIESFAERYRLGWEAR
jgi:hypothetical protein